MKLRKKIFSNIWSTYVYLRFFLVPSPIIILNNSRFFKKSDRDRHMKSKHDSKVACCHKCLRRFSSKESFLVHEKECTVAADFPANSDDKQDDAPSNQDAAHASSLAPLHRLSRSTCTPRTHRNGYRTDGISSPVHSTASSLTRNDS